MLKDVPVEELQAEIERRDKIRREQEKPKQLACIDLSELKAQCAYQIESLESGDYREKQYQYIYEAAMEAFYGKNVWEWINKKLT